MHTSFVSDDQVTAVGVFSIQGAEAGFAKRQTERFPRETSLQPLGAAWISNLLKWRHKTRASCKQTERECDELPHHSWNDTTGVSAQPFVSLYIRQWWQWRIGPLRHDPHNTRKLQFTVAEGLRSLAAEANKNTICAIPQVLSRTRCAPRPVLENHNQHENKGQPWQSAVPTENVLDLTLTMF